MADIRKAVEFMLRQEDARLSGTVTNAASDNGGFTRFGLCAKWHPALVAAGFFTPQMPRDKALLMAEETYSTEYAPALRLAGLRRPFVRGCGRNRIRSEVAPPVAGPSGMRSPGERGSGG